MSGSSTQQSCEEAATMTRKKTGDSRPPVAVSPPSPGLPDRRLMEQQMAQIGQLLQSRDFASMEEANAFIQEMLATGGIPDAVPHTPLDQAQEVVYQALEATGKRRVTLARKALTISPDCADAYVLLAEATRNPTEAKARYEQGVEAGERALGPQPFKEDVGHFWGIMETRPYMRARQGLAEVLWVLGERRDAIGHATDMLRLNPGDNQGIRYLLANWLLAEGEDDALDRLLKAYPDEGSAAWAYTRALLTFRRKGAGAAATRALKTALRTNPHVPFYLFGLRELPEELPGYIGMGDESEAVAYVAESITTWIDTEGALDWFAGIMGRLATQATARPRRR
jgi:tetratricopeptide (TPR) repeat protein